MNGFDNEKILKIEINIGARFPLPNTFTITPKPISAPKTDAIYYPLTKPEIDFGRTEILCTPDNFYSCTALQSSIHDELLISIRQQIIYFSFNFKETKDETVDFSFETQNVAENIDFHLVDVLNFDITVPVFSLPEIQDLADEYQAFALPNIVNIKFLLNKSIIDGKAYTEESKKESEKTKTLIDAVYHVLKQNGVPMSAPEIYHAIADQFPYESAGLGARRVKEGIKKNIDRFGERSRFGKDESGKYYIRFPKKEQKEQVKKIKKINIFDLIQPLLMPPLDSNFDSQLAFSHDLYPYQVDGVRFLQEHTSALLGDEMGLGKSIQTITACRSLIRQGKIMTVLVICPKAVLTDWERKFWDWSPELLVRKISGNKEARQSQWRMPVHVRIVTYELLRNDFDEINKQRIRNKRKHHFDLLVLDEIQKTKNPAVQTTKMVRTVTAHYRWGLSGTPLENKIEDLETICETLQPDIWEHFDSLEDGYKSISLRRRARDVLKDLPEKMTDYIWLDLLPTQQQKYLAAESAGKEDLKQLGKDATKITIFSHVFALINHLQQICNIETESGESVKLEYLQNDLEQLTEEGNKALVFSKYPNVTLREMMPHLQQFNPHLYDGSLSDNQRNKIIDDFQNGNNSKIMLLSLKAGNAGITLTRANYVFHFDMWWNPSVSAQATGRVLRIGQKAETVFERFLLTRGTIEERIYEKVEEKKELFNHYVDDLSESEEGISKFFTEDDLFGLFGLQSPNSTKSSSVNLENNTETYLPDPLDFEKRVCDLFEKMGYHTRLTQKSRDGGVDIFAKKQNISGSYDEVIIQCKHKEQADGMVGIQSVRELFGVLRSNNRFTKGILVTNGFFSQDAVSFAKDNGIELIDGLHLKGVEIKYGKSGYS
ncbi:MAG: restriction endonuclease [Planctomycetaceae bacterium]|jgi:SNF2 family DNA or RNA helicase|nr:restriction endonuclease [Planctomycetaceae bacterium]